MIGGKLLMGGFPAEGRRFESCRGHSYSLQVKRYFGEIRASACHLCAIFARFHRSSAAPGAAGHGRLGTLVMSILRRPSRTTDSHSMH